MEKSRRRSVWDLISPGSPSTPKLGPSKYPSYSALPIPSIKINSGEGPLEPSAENVGELSLVPDEKAIIEMNSGLLESPTIRSRSRSCSSLFNPRVKEAKPELSYEELQSLLVEHKIIKKKAVERENKEQKFRMNLNRPRLFSHPLAIPPGSFIPDIQTAPTTSSRFYFPYFRRASNVSTQGFVLSESMTSLTNKALISFIAEENFSGLQHLLENRRVIIDDRDENGTTALMIAASKGKPNFVRALIEHGADVNAEDGDSWTALLFAAKEGHEDIIADLLDNGAKVDHRDMGGWTPLMWASYKGRTKSAKILMDKGADVNSYGNYNLSSLAWAAGRGHLDIVRYLIQHGAKVNIGDKYGTTPLIWAARKGHLEIVDCLLNAEAHVDACGMTSWTPLLVATAGNHVEVVKILLENKPNLNALDVNGCSALTISCKEGFHEIAIALINHGAYINVNDRSGTSNLIHAAKIANRSIVEALLKKHADVNVQGKDRKTALYWAVEKNNQQHIPIVKLIVSGNADLDLATKDGDTPLMKAVRNRNSEIVSILLEKRAKVSAVDKNGDTCLHIGMRARSKQIVELLLRNPVHSQLLYRPNRAGETPYNIDRNSPKPILPQIFGSRGLNTQEDGENLLGYNLYSSALADMLSDPTLNLPITIGLYAKWGSGKAFLLAKLREEMKSFAMQWMNPSFAYNLLIFILIFCFSTLVGVIAGLALQNWIIGVSFALGIISIIHIFLFIVWISSRRSKFDYSWSHKMSSYLGTKLNSLQLICQVIFCYPPGTARVSEQLQAQPINFYFTEQTKISSSTGGENIITSMLASLYSHLEMDYGFATRLFRAFTPKPVNPTSDWKWRKLCCIPYCLVVLFCFGSTLLGIVLLALYLTDMGKEFGSNLALEIVMYACPLIVGLLIVANLYTISKVLKAILFSHQRHLQRTVSKFYAVKAEGFLHALKAEVNLLTDMVKCLDAFTGRQSRLVIVVDALDSGEQEKVLLVLDAVHMLFSDPKAPFILLLAIDPHIIAKGIELNINPVLNESNIGGHDYLRNLVHLPFYLQNAALRKVKHVKMLESTLKRRNTDEDPVSQLLLQGRRPSVESSFGVLMPLEKFDKPSSKKGKRLGIKMSESIASSLGSNLNKTSGPNDLKKMLLGDDYFSDVNPRTMRRLMNIIHITGRLLKAFSIDFNWYQLSSWINLTEQWPYRLSWMIIYCEHFQKDLDDSMLLKGIFERVKPFIPISKEVDPNIILDRDEKKLEVYLGLHKSLLVSTLYVFLPFAISLDPQIKKDLTEQYQPIEQIFKQNPSSSSNAQQQPHLPPNFNQNLRYRMTGIRNGQPFTPIAPLPQYLPMNGQQSPINQIYPNFWPFQPMPLIPQPSTSTSFPSVPDAIIKRELRNKKLSTLGVEGISDLIGSLSGLKGSNVGKYQEAIRKNNINGMVCLTCDLNELKAVLQMTFGDWEMFKSALSYLRDFESRIGEVKSEGDSSIRINVTSPEKESNLSMELEPKKATKPNTLEKQITMEQQMISGALELLNDEAKEDARRGEESSTSTLSPIHSEPEIPETCRLSRKSYVDHDETDVLYVMGNSTNLSAELPDSPSIVRKLEERQGKVSSINEVSVKSSETMGQGKHLGSPKKIQRNLNRNASAPAASTSPLRKLKGETTRNSRSPATPQRKTSKKMQSAPRDESSSDTSSDESQKPLVTRTSAPITHARKISSNRGSRTDNPPSPKKRISKDEPNSRFSKIKTSFFGPGAAEHGRDERVPEAHYSGSAPVPGSSSSMSDSKPAVAFRSIRDRYDPYLQQQTEDSEPGLYFSQREGQSYGQPWTQYRAPTPLPPFGSEEYYRVIKSSNPSPTTSNESEIGSSVGDLSSREELFLPDPPDMPESPFPRRNVPRPEPTSSFVPFRATSPPDPSLNERVSSPPPLMQGFSPIPSSPKESSFNPIGVSTPIDSPKVSSPTSGPNQYRDRVLSPGPSSSQHLMDRVSLSRVSSPPPATPMKGPSRRESPMASALPFDENWSLIAAGLVSPDANLNYSGYPVLENLTTRNLEDFERSFDDPMMQRGRERRDSLESRADSHKDLNEVEDQQGNEETQKVEKMRRNFGRGITTAEESWRQAEGMNLDLLQGRLVRSSFNRSDPVLSSSTSSNLQRTTIMAQMGRAPESPLRRQQALEHPESSRENTPQK